MIVKKHVLGAMLLIGCAPSRDGYVKDEVIGAARNGEFTSLDQDLRLAVCGWRPDSKFEGAKVTTSFTGDDKKGTGEAKATFLKGSSGIECEGTIAFEYEYHPARKAPAYYALTEVHRVGAPAAFAATVESKATALALDAPAKAAFETWHLPDGAYGVAFKVDIAVAGDYRVAFATIPDAPRVVVYQKQLAVREGNRGGALGFWTLQPGPSTFFMHSARAETRDLRITSDTK